MPDRCYAERYRREMEGQPYLDMGLILRTEQRLDESLNYLETAAEFEPHNPETHFELAKTYETLHKHKEAEAQFRIVLTIAPNASAVHYILGRVLKSEGHASEGGTGVCPNFQAQRHSLYKRSHQFQFFRFAVDQRRGCCQPNPKVTGQFVAAALPGRPSLRILKSNYPAQRRMTSLPFRNRLKSEVWS